jgi:hypothetical protein
VPRRRLAVTVNAGQPRATINAVWLSLLPGPAGVAAVTMMMMMDRVATGLMPGYVNVLAGSGA